MLRTIIRRPSLGTVFGLLALFVALGGVATAQTTPTTTPPVVPGVTPVAEAQHAVHADYADAARVSRIEYVTEQKESGSDDVVNIAVDCPDGMNVVGGGTTNSDDENLEVTASGPVGDDGWLVKMDGVGDGEVVRATAICVNAAETDSDTDRKKDQ